MYDATICIPGIRPENLAKIIYSVDILNPKYNYEIIFIGPNKPEDKFLSRVKYIESFAHPTKCVQLAAMKAKGKLITWASDDGVYLKDGLDEAVTMWYKDRGTEFDEIIIRYFEGQNFSGNYQSQPLDGPRQSYWHAHFHPNLQLPAIPKHYKIAPLGLMKTESFIIMGGFDCRFEHINMSCIDLSVRLQNGGYGVYLSPLPVFTCDFDDNDNSVERSPVIRAYHENDNPLFTSIYSSPTGQEREIILFVNYREVPDTWARRFK